METVRTKSFRFLDFELDCVRRTLSRDGLPIALNPKAFDLLLALVESRGEVLTKDDLLERVWPEQIVEEANLKVHISTLRKAFGEGAGEHRFIVTVPGRGYSFVADLDDDDTEQLLVESHSYSDILVEDTETVSDELVDERPTARISVNRAAAVAVSLVVVLATAYFMFLREPATADSPRSVAVLPFANQSGNTDLEYLSDGLTESIIARLSRVRDLSVRASSVVARYKGKEAELAKIGSDLAVGAILTGKVVSKGDEITLYAELVEPATGRVLWKAAYDRPRDELPTLETAVARDVAKSLKAKLSSSDQDLLQRGRTERSEAYELYLRGLQFSREGSTLERLMKSVECYEQAIKIDPKYADAYVGLAWTQIRLGTMYGYRPGHETFPKAREALLKAVEIDENVPGAHSALALYYLYYEWNWQAAQREFELAIALEPDEPGPLLDYGTYYDTLGRANEAIQMRERARRLFPAAASALNGLGHSYLYARRYDEAVNAYNGALELNPRLAWAYHGRGKSYLDTNRPNEAVSDIEKAAELFGRSPRSLAVLGNFYARVGREENARRILAELKQRAANEYVGSYYFALVYAGLRDYEHAFAFLEKAREERQPQMIFLRVESLLDDLRSDPRFDVLVKKVGVPE